jgi:hypothetical protein
LDKVDIPTVNKFSGVNQWVWVLAKAVTQAQFAQEDRKINVHQAE